MAIGCFQVVAGDPAHDIFELRESAAWIGDAAMIAGLSTYSYRYAGYNQNMSLADRPVTQPLLADDLGSDERMGC